ncbi:MAG: 3-deoxy-manno-octulosonate cytidylyltransferase [SAR324 cluster bacterium]|nr:3-deoxy-manno-octulosonate cytidylyltransferase [SAR324 cluster bacterium]
MSVIAVIPARYQSSRFPGKPLADLAGKPMIQQVYERVTQVDAIDRVLIATDDQRIFEAVKMFGGNVIMTRSDHQTGTDRIVEAISSVECEWVLNVQGDEPLVDPGDLENLIQQTKQQESAKVSTLMYPIEDNETFNDPNVVKLIINARKEALYFSRSPIPFEKEQHMTRWRHIGVYLYQREFLLQFNQWERTELELTEQLEQLRILDNGYSIFCVQAQKDGVGVDRPEDLIEAEKLLLSQG